MQPDPSDAYEALVQFLYRAPIGLAQAAPDGAIDMLNPMASNLLMPVALSEHGGGFENLFSLLAPIAPAARGTGARLRRTVGRDLRRPARRAAAGDDGAGQPAVD